MSSDGDIKHDAFAIGPLHQVVEAVVDFGIDRLRRHEHQREFLGLARNQIFSGDVGNVLADVGPQPLPGGAALVVGLGLAIGGDAFEREFGVDDQRTLVRHEHAAVGAGAVRQRMLERIGALWQAILNDQFHPPLPEGAA